MQKGRQILGMAVIACCLLGLAVNAYATTRVEAELASVDPEGTSGEFLVPSASPLVDGSGNWMMDTRSGWSCFGYFVAPAAGDYDITFRMSAHNAAGSSLFYRITNSVYYRGILNWSWASGESTVAFSDYTYTFSLAEGANIIDLGFGSGNFYFDYLEFDETTGLRYQPISAANAPLRLEAEDAVLTGNTGATSIDTDADASGGAFLNINGPHWNGTGTPPVTATFTFTVSAAQAAVRHTIRYVAKHAAYPDGATTSNPDGANAGCNDQLLINGSIKGRTQIPYRDADFHEMQIRNVQLNTGTNTIAITSYWWYIDYDYIEIDGIGTAVPCGEITASGTGFEGTTLTLTAPPTVATPGQFGAWSYQWMLDGNPLSNGDGVSGANARELILSDLSDANIGSYTVSYVQDEGNAVVSEPYVISEVNPAAPMPVAGLVGLGVLAAALAGAYRIRAKK